MGIKNKLKRKKTYEVKYSKLVKDFIKTGKFDEKVNEK